MDRVLSRTVHSLADKKYVNNATIKKFTDRIKMGPPFFRNGKSSSHFCTFLIPINLKSQSIFIGHHIKGDSWMPPGGHIDSGETPLQTVKREWQEELKTELTNEKIELFDISIIHIDNPKLICKTHYDFWHLVHCEKINFDYDKKEFYEAGWHNIDEARKLVTNPTYVKVFDKLARYFFEV